MFEWGAVDQVARVSGIVAAIVVLVVIAQGSIRPSLNEAARFLAAVIASGIAVYLFVLLVFDVLVQFDTYFGDQFRAEVDTGLVVLRISGAYLCVSVAVRIFKWLRLDNTFRGTPETREFADMAGLPWYGHFVGELDVRSKALSQWAVFLVCLFFLIEVGRSDATSRTFLATNVLFGLVVDDWSIIDRFSLLTRGRTPRWLGRRNTAATLAVGGATIMLAFESLGDEWGVVALAVLLVVAFGRYAESRSFLTQDEIGLELDSSSVSWSYSSPSSDDQVIVCVWVCHEALGWYEAVDMHIDHSGAGSGRLAFGVPSTPTQKSGNSANWRLGASVSVLTTNGMRLAPAHARVDI